MPNECRIDSMRSKERLFEWQDTGNLIDPSPELFHSPWRPRPKLRRDKLQRRDAAFMRRPCEMKVHRRRIDANPQVRPVFIEIFARPAEQSIYFPRPQNSPPAHGGLGDGVAVQGRAG